MNKISKYTKLGILVILCVTILIVGINYLKGVNVLNKTTTLYANYPRVDGLVKSSNILINGFKVGLVQDVKFSERNDGSFIVKLSVEGDFKIPKDSKAVIASSDLLGTKAIKIEIKQGNEYYQDGDTINSRIEADLIESLIPIKADVESVLSTIDSTLNINLDQKGRENIKSIIENLNYTMINLNNISTKLDKILISDQKKIENIISNFDKLSETLVENSENINTIASNFAKLSDSLVNTNFKNITSELSEITNKINNGKGTAGKLINDEVLYSNILSITENLESLLIDLKSNPGKYVNIKGIDWGKEIYISGSDIKENENYTFKVELIKSSSKLDIDSDIFTQFKSFGLIEELNNNNYRYFTGNTNNFNDITSILLKAKEKFSSAQIIAFKNNNEIKLKKAIKKLNN